MMQNGRRKSPKHGKIKQPKKPVDGSKLYPIISGGRSCRVVRENGFYVAYEDDGGGQDRGPTTLGTFVSADQAEACLRGQRLGIPKKAKQKNDCRDTPDA